jgi:hypothetical protein
MQQKSNQRIKISKRKRAIMACENKYEHNS